MGYRLSNHRLYVEISDIDAVRGARFDRTGFITQVQIKEGGHTFCVPESLQPGQGTGGIGICNEFGLFQPIGYDETAAGEAFPKFGVGLLTRQDSDAYAFHKSYPVAPFDVDVENAPDQISYIVHPKDCKGYSAQLKKTVSIRDATLTIQYQLHNTGSKKIKTHEYAHNFLGINNCFIGPDYTLKFPHPTRFEGVPQVPEFMAICDSAAGWQRAPDREFYLKLQGFQNERRPFYWELLHRPSGAGVREISRFPVSMMALWGASHVVSPEVFIDICLAPGEFKEWSRVYQFFAD